MAHSLPTEARHRSSQDGYCIQQPCALVETIGGWGRLLVSSCMNIPKTTKTASAARLQLIEPPRVYWFTCTLILVVGSNRNRVLIIASGAAGAQLALLGFWNKRLCLGKQFHNSIATFWTLAICCNHLNSPIVCCLESCVEVKQSPVLMKDLDMHAIAYRHYVWTL